MSSTLEELRETARETVRRGHADFRVLAREGGHRPGTTFYYVVVPYALKRLGFGGQIGPGFLGTTGTATKFGDELFDRLVTMKGIEPSLDHETPHVLTVVVTDDAAMDGPPEGGFYYLSKGLPESVCTVIQMAIDDVSLMQRRMEYLRRLF